MNIFDMNKNSLPEQVQTNKDNIEYLMTNASEFSCVLRAAIAPTFNIDNNYNVGDLVWYNMGTMDRPQYYLFEANTNITAGTWDGTQWNLVKLKDLLDEINASVNAKITPTVLWTNPDTSVDFAGQTIAIADSTPYNYLIIEYVYVKETSDRLNKFILIKNENASSQISDINISSSDIELVCRSISLASPTSFVFGTCRKAAIDGTITSSNGNLVPIAIYGTNIL